MLSSGTKKPSKKVEKQDNFFFQNQIMFTAGMLSLFDKLQVSIHYSLAQ